MISLGKKPGNSGEVGEIFRICHLPLALGDVELFLCAVVIGDLEEADHRKVRTGKFCFRSDHTRLQGPFHIRLATCDPHVSNVDVLDSLSIDQEFVWSTGRQRWQLNRPSAVCRYL